MQDLVSCSSPALLFTSLTSRLAGTPFVSHACICLSGVFKTPIEPAKCFSGTVSLLLSVNCRSFWVLKCSTFLPLPRWLRGSWHWAVPLHIYGSTKSWSQPLEWLSLATPRLETGFLWLPRHGPSGTHGRAESPSLTVVTYRKHWRFEAPEPVGSWAS